MCIAKTKSGWRGCHVCEGPSVGPYLLRLPDVELLGL